MDELKSLEICPEPPFLKNELSSIKEILVKCKKYEAWFKKHPPRLLGHLKGGINLERMLKLKEEIENNGHKLNRILVKTSMKNKLNRKNQRFPDHPWRRTK